MSIPVICDRCRATGSSGEADFAHLGDLLDFTPVPRKTTRVDGWSPDKQRAFIAALSATGSKRRSALAIGMAPFGVEQLLKADGNAGFKAAFERAMAIAAQAGSIKIAQGVADAAARNAQLTPPSRLRGVKPLLPGQVYNEQGVPEDQASLDRRGEDARDSIGNKLLACRRAYLCEISHSPGKRAAFEILTELPIDWAKARRMEPQDHEPWRRPNMRKPDMVVTAESGWLGTIVPAYGPDKMAELRRALNQHRMECGLEPVDVWTDEDRASAGRQANDGDDDEDAVLHAWAARHGGPAPEAASTGRHSRDGGNPAPTDGIAPEGPPPMRSFGLNSQEFYDVVAKPGRKARIEPRKGDTE